MLRKGCLLFSFAFFVSCSGIEEAQNSQIKERNERKDRIHRSSSEVQYPPLELVKAAKVSYPWEIGYTGIHPRITCDFFRCKGDSLHPPRAPTSDKNILFHDCGGARKHSLPIREGKEFVYPILLDLLNYLQIKMGAKVVITCGHRCPDHHKYVDSSAYNSNSKHMIGAEVDFYVVGFEEKPLEVITQIMQYYKEAEPYKQQKDYENFQRLEEGKINVSTPPWYNKEILIKLYQAKEGRDFDNQHSYPYISLQVRFDRERQEKVVYSWEKAWGGYMRY